nr:cation diffusion facilitator family transporter [Eubacterium sp.]
LSSLIIAGLVLYAGITAGYESIKKIFEPENPDYTIAAFVIISVSLVVKLFLGWYVKRVGKKVNSGALIASGTDAFFDAIISASVLASAIIFVITGLNLEAYVGVLISLVIIKTGIEIMKDTLDEILGKRVDRKLMEAIQATICEEKDVMGAYDLILHNYGPDKYVASVHVEIPEELTAREIDLLARSIAERVYEKHSVIMAGVGIYALNTTDEDVISLREKASETAMSFEGVIQTHGFYIDEEKKTIYLDIIIDYEVEDRHALLQEVCEKLQTIKPDYKWSLTPDIDF